MTIGIKTRRYSAVFRRILETYQEDVEITVNGKRFTEADIPNLEAV